MPMLVPSAIADPTTWSVATFGFIPLTEDEEAAAAATEAAEAAQASSLDAEEGQTSKNRTFPVAPLLWWSTIDKSQEEAGPGFYKSYLVEPSVGVSLLALGTHAGQHTYSFEQQQPSPAVAAAAETVSDATHKSGHAARLCHLLTT
jgi:hypothetical protein